VLKLGAPGWRAATTWSSRAEHREATRPHRPARPTGTAAHPRRTRARHWHRANPHRTAPPHTSCRTRARHSHRANPHRPAPGPRPVAGVRCPASCGAVPGDLVPAAAAQDLPASRGVRARCRPQEGPRSRLCHQNEVRPDGSGNGQLGCGEKCSEDGHSAYLHQRSNTLGTPPL
jgi:hypothetical protein